MRPKVRIGVNPCASTQRGIFTRRTGLAAERGNAQTRARSIPDPNVKLVQCHLIRDVLWALAIGDQLAIDLEALHCLLQVPWLEAVPKPKSPF